MQAMASTGVLVCLCGEILVGKILRRKLVHALWHHSTPRSLLCVFSCTLADYCDGIEKPSYLFMICVIPPVRSFHAFLHARTHARQQCVSVLSREFVLRLQTAGPCPDTSA